MLLVVQCGQAVSGSLGEPLGTGSQIPVIQPDTRQMPVRCPSEPQQNPNPEAKPTPEAKATLEAKALQLSDTSPFRLLLGD